MHALALQKFENRDGYIVVLTVDQAVGHLDDRDLASKPTEHLPELQADVTASDDDEMRRKEINPHHRTVGEERDAVESGHGRSCSPSSHIEEDPLGGQSVIANAHLVRRRESCVPAQSGAVLKPAQP